MINVGIGIITRNRRKELSQVIEAIVDHTGIDHELAVSLDRCTDDTRDYLYKRFPEYTGFRGTDLPDCTIIDPPQAGIAASRNAVLHHFRDKNVIFMFEDDYMPIVDAWEQPYLAVLSEETPVLFALDQSGHGDVLAKRFYCREYGNRTYTGNVLYRERLTTQMIAMHTSVLKMVGYFNPAYGTRYGFEDSEWGCRGRDSGIFGNTEGFPCLEQEGKFQHIANPVSGDGKTQEEREADIKVNWDTFKDHAQRPTFLPYPYQKNE